MVDNRPHIWVKKNHPIIQSNKPFQQSYEFIISHNYPINILSIPYAFLMISLLFPMHCFEKLYFACIPREFPYWSLCASLQRCSWRRRSIHGRPPWQRIVESRTRCTLQSQHHTWSSTRRSCRSIVCVLHRGLHTSLGVQ